METLTMSNPLRKMFETTPDVERDGLWLEYAPGVEIKIARAGGANKKFATTMKRLAKPHRRAIQTGTVDEDILEGLFRQAYAQTIVLDWKGITKDLVTKNDDDAGEELEFNQANVEGVLMAQPNLFADIQAASDDMSLYRAEVQEQDSKN
jgi:hypothetical protein